ncbi:MAG: hypothetical protein Q7S98_01360 [Deltaproteobacteria bacterium]|nr:hypothetical protein [Deltaproteobacteria bacterium]
MGGPTEVKFVPVIAGGSTTQGGGAFIAGAGVSFNRPIGDNFQPFLHIVPQYNFVLSGGQETRRAGCAVSAGGFVTSFLHLEAGAIPQYNFSNEKFDLGARASSTALLPIQGTFGLGFFAQMPDVTRGDFQTILGLQLTGLL